MPEASHARAIAALGHLGPLRVWSLLVTVFGDLAPDQPMDGPTLTAIMAAIGIKPEATRVALHRLRADGWITSEKFGRISRHRLSPKAQADSDRARPQIYGPVPQDTDVQLILMPDDNSVPDPQHFARVSARLFAGLRSIAPPPQAAILQVNTLPDWFVTQIETEDLRRAYAALHAVLTHIAQNAEMHRDLGPRDQAVLRVMIVHAWRRLALRHPLLPAVAHSRDWMGHACRIKVTALLDAIPRPPLDHI